MSTSPSTQPAPHPQSPHHVAGSNVVALVLAWGAVGVPFAYGVIKTVQKAAALFGG